MSKLALVAIVVTASLAAPRLARACSPPPCWPGAFVPGDGANVPANVPGLYWRPMHAASGDPIDDPAKVVLAGDADPTTPLAFTASPLAGGDYLLVPDAPLVEGAGYTLRDGNLCEATGQPGPSVAFTATAAVELPTTLGGLAVTDEGIGPLTVGTSSGSCSTDVTADRASIALAPAVDAMPWLDVLQFETRVDGSAWQAAANLDATTPPGESWQGRGNDLVYELCETSDASAFAGLAAGSHEVEVRATLPGSQLALATPAATFTLACPDDPGMGTDDPPPFTDQPVEGCASAGAGGAPGLVLALGALLVVRRRRR